jgi:hypothetical protein
MVPVKDLIYVLPLALSSMEEPNLSMPNTVWEIFELNLWQDFCLLQFSVVIYKEFVK